MPESFNLESLEKALLALGEKPILQAIAIYDCEQTREQVISIDYKAPFENVVLTFMENAGPVVRWFFKPFATHFLVHSRFLAFDNEGEEPLFKYEPGPINSYGFALVMSQKSYEAWAKATTEPPADSLNLFQPRIYDLNKKESQ